ncbi:MAG: formate dehydrogenase accessory sulfurtransferase FdhD [Verrucomicrobiales bacterium]|nr:formate dehydrogenase accessory sulfurtransferase FdhD [Verrucomicrobiales bacterium]
MNTTASRRRLVSDPEARVIRVRRWEGGGEWASVRDSVTVEEPLELRVNTRSVAVVMRTPGHDDELAVGFLLSEGVVRRREDIVSIRPYARNREGNVLDIHLADAVVVDFQELTRHVFGASSCGLCGKATVEAVRRQFPPVRETFEVTADRLALLPDAMRVRQAGFDATGGVHAAGLFNSDGRLVCLREDVGRHNAVDKVIGRCWLEEGRVPSGAVLVVSGRASFEILQKALAARVAFIAAVGAPSSLAVDFARRSGQTLVGFVRSNRFNVYAGHGRVRMAEKTALRMGRRTRHPKQVTSTGSTTTG